MLFFRRYLNWCHWHQPELVYISPPRLLLFLVLMVLRIRIYTTLRVSNSRIIRGRMLHISVLQYWQILSTLIVPEPLNPSTLDTSLESLRKFLILYSISGQLRGTRKLNILLRNFVFVTSMSGKMRSSLPMGTWFKRPWVNTAALLTQISGNTLI